MRTAEGQNLADGDYDYLSCLHATVEHSLEVVYKVVTEVVTFFQLKHPCKYRVRHTTQWLSNFVHPMSYLDIGKDRG